MANPAAAHAKKKIPVNTWLIAGLGVLIVIAIVFAISNKRESVDPTLTAAPPIVATPGHPIVLHTKSPEAMAKQMQQAGIAPPADASGQPSAK
ncbi:hypothetical protein CCAX7_17810 [Capsulimonas corticalis]|uniref:Uncharacterized protein n=1 Tax=Capsulimonas corticalis TaxID=2219043 RepID=A0A402D3Q1_9BACT|nr:hypothetical protein [Capsulimonas corticalis]BDI29730.1 hypothetical protein CCAX7_17810 [Capsulimonas corticalis]